MGRQLLFYGGIAAIAIIIGTLFYSYLLYSEGNAGVTPKGLPSGGRVGLVVVSPCQQFSTDGNCTGLDVEYGSGYMQQCCEKEKLCC